MITTGKPLPFHRRAGPAYTLVEIMVVVVIIGLIAAAGLPSYRHLTMRSKVTSLENDVRQFSTAAQVYAAQNGRWPTDTVLGAVPPELAGALPVTFTARTPIGGLYKWHNGTSADGVACKTAILVQTSGSNVMENDVALLEMVDAQMDDGNLTEGLIQTGGPGSLVFVVEK